METLVALVVLQVRVEDFPFWMVVGLAERVAVGLGGGGGGGGSSEGATGTFFLQPPEIAIRSANRHRAARFKNFLFFIISFLRSKMGVEA
jgi:hypothetical protein